MKIKQIEFVKYLAFYKFYREKKEIECHERDMFGILNSVVRKPSLRR